MQTRSWQPNVCSNIKALSTYMWVFSHICLVFHPYANRSSGHQKQGFWKTPSRVKIFPENYIILTVCRGNLGVLSFVNVVCLCNFISSVTADTANVRHNQHSASFNIPSRMFYTYPDKYTSMAFSWVLIILYSSVKFRNNSTLLVCICDFPLHLYCCCCWAFSGPVPFFHFSSGSDYPTCLLAQRLYRHFLVWPMLDSHVDVEYCWCVRKFFLFLHEGWKNVFLKMPSSMWTRPNPLLAANCSVLFLTKLQGTRTWHASSYWGPFLV